MNRGQSVFAQLLGFVPFSHFEHLVDRFASNHGIRHFSAWNHFLCIAYSQLTWREGLRDLVACLNSQRSKLYHGGGITAEPVLATAVAAGETPTLGDSDGLVPWVAYGAKSSLAL